MRPFFRHFGSKWTLSKHLPDPAFPVIEPFGGAAGYSVSKDAPTVWVNDKDVDTIAIWKFIRTHLTGRILAQTDGTFFRKAQSELLWTPHSRPTTPPG